MDPFARQPGWWGHHRAPPEPLSVVELMVAGSLDAGLAALLWLLVEGRLPIVVAAEQPLAGKSTTLMALMDFLPAGVAKRFLRGQAEDFAWLPEVIELGWPGVDVVDLAGSLRTVAAVAAGNGTVAATPERVDPQSTYLLCAKLSADLPEYTWGLRARVLVRALQLGYGLGTTMDANSLEEVITQLAAPPVKLTEDEVRRLGVVLILQLLGPDGRPLVVPAGTFQAELLPLQRGVRRRIAAAHYLRPLERDGRGHLQRRPPAVLATWDMTRDGFDHFAWGLTAELAERVGRSRAEFEREHAHRTSYLRELTKRGVTALPAVRDAIQGFAAAVAGAHRH